VKIVLIALTAALIISTAHAQTGDLKLRSNAGGGFEGGDTKVLTLVPAQKIVFADAFVFADILDGGTLICWKGECKRLSEVWPKVSSKFIYTPSNQLVQRLSDVTPSRQLAPPAKEKQK